MNDESKQQDEVKGSYDTKNVVLQPKLKFSMGEQEVKSTTIYGLKAMHIKVANTFAFILVLFSWNTLLKYFHVWGVFRFSALEISGLSAHIFSYFRKR